MTTLAALDFQSLTTRETVVPALRIAFLMGVGLPAIIITSALVGRATAKKLSAQSAMLAKKTVLYFGIIVIVVAVFQQTGYELTALIGAAGVAGIAIGFASQTSLSNIISGIFLISEKPFQVGDIIKVGETKGTILSIDLLSVKLRTFDNQLVRMPNETLIKEKVTNITRFPIRRVDLNIGVAYKEDPRRVRDILLDIADKNSHCLDEPEPLFRSLNFGDSALEFLFAVWCVKSDYLKVNTDMMLEIKVRFDAEGIEIPFPHRTLYTGSATGPLPIYLVDKQQEQAPKNESSES
jgi:small-conductance mechanosensitive channel